MVCGENALFTVTITVLFTVCSSDLLDDLNLGSLAKAFSPPCKFECKNGAKPRPKPLHKPSSNGCGSFGLQLDFGDDLPQMTSCCDKHDVCYDTCNKDREKCDDDFHTCLKDLCDKQYSKHRKQQKEDCIKAVMMMYSGATALGCSPYLEAQKKACSCQRTVESKERNRRAETKNEL